jgi:predicted O-methyltransferase YrrM
MLKRLAKKLPKPIKNIILKTINANFVKQLINLNQRRNIAMAYYRSSLLIINKWIWMDTETSNFYYKLTPFNINHLAHLISVVTGTEYQKILMYIEELESDSELREYLELAIKRSGYGKDIKVEYGRRLGWYAFVRALKPKVVVETGVDHGVGSCVLASALLRNLAEGCKGKYYGTEIRSEAGQLFAGKYASIGEILYGDSITSLNSLSENIDFFVNDSDHSEEYEYMEYLSISNKLSSHAIILGDNAHATDSLSIFSVEQKRKFIFFSEKPENHWYPGAGIGISYI